MKIIIITKSILSVFLCSILTSCATHFGTLSSGVVEQKITYVDHASGSAETKKILGIGGLRKEGLVSEARRVLIKNRPLREGEQYVNYTIDFKYSIFPFLIKTKAIITADIIRFTNSASDNIYTEEYLNKIGIANDLFHIGDTVLFGDNLEGIVVMATGTDSYKISFKIKEERKTKEVSVDKLYTNRKSFKGYEIHESFTSKTYDSGEEKSVSGEIIKLGQNHLIIKLSSGNLVKCKYLE